MTRQQRRRAARRTEYVLPKTFKRLGDSYFFFGQNREERRKEAACLRRGQESSK